MEFDFDDRKLEQAVLWEKADGDKVKCKLCNFRCSIKPGNVGHCGVRKNIDGLLYSLNYDRVCAANADPVEKKPLFHFFPGSTSFSIACPGCNFTCSFCQNWQISQAATDGEMYGRAIRPKDIIDSAVHANSKSIAYTYTEPTVFMELAAKCGPMAHDHEMYNVFVSNGYMTTEAIDLAKDWLDGINIDLKAFTDKYYKDLCGASLKPVLETIKYIATQTDIWMEITTLLVPGQNDSKAELKDLAQFIANEAGKEVPWHISRFFPQYNMDDIPPTSKEKLYEAYDIGKEAGLNYVYIGNMSDGRTENTYCPSCGTLLIERTGYTIKQNNIDDGTCPRCGHIIAGFGM